MPLGERFPAFYDINDGRFYDKSDLIIDLLQSDMSGLKIASNRVDLRFGGNHSNWRKMKG